MGKGTTTVSPDIPWQLSRLYQQTAENVLQGQTALPLLGQTGVNAALPRGGYPHYPTKPDPDPTTSTPDQSLQIKAAMPAGVLPPPKKKRNANEAGRRRR